MDAIAFTRFYKRKRMPVYQLKRQQKLPSSIGEVWEFISKPENLSKITPEAMEFRILTRELPDKIYPGMIISYRVRPLLRLKMNWVTEITHVEDNRYFVDEQRHGPYTLWHHEHFVESIDGGVLMTDIITYKPPGGILGGLANRLFIRRQLRQIFDYRFVALENRFGIYP